MGKSPTFLTCIFTKHFYISFDLHDNPMSYVILSAPLYGLETEISEIMGLVEGCPAGKPMHFWLRHTQTRLRKDRVFPHLSPIKNTPCKYGKRNRHNVWLF